MKPSRIRLVLYTALLSDSIAVSVQVIAIAIYCNTSAAFPVDINFVINGQNHPPAFSPQAPLAVFLRRAFAILPHFIEHNLVGFVAW